MGKPFTRVTLRGLFRSTALINETVIRFREKRVVLRHDAILDTATFDALQVMLNAHRRQQRSEVFYAVGGIANCGCGARFEGVKTGTGRYYYRCSAHCGEKWWRKDDFEREIYNAFYKYLEQRESQCQMLEIAQQSLEKLQRDEEDIERSIAKNLDEWRTLLDMELANYPDVIVNEKKRELTTEREALLRRKARLATELEQLPHIDPIEVEVALNQLRKDWGLCNLVPTPGYPWAMSWERVRGILTPEQAQLLRQTLLRLNTRITIKNRAIFLSGSLTLRDFRVKQAAS